MDLNRPDVKGLKELGDEVTEACHEFGEGREDEDGHRSLEGALRYANVALGCVLAVAIAIHRAAEAAERIADKMEGN